MSNLDLHMHSNYSADGEFTPNELIQKCELKNLKVVSLTDHNSIKGMPEMISEGKKQGIYVLSGVELDVTFKEVNLHLLGYGIGDDQRFHDYESIIYEQELSASTFKMTEIEKLGIPFSKDKIFEFSQGGIVTGEMIGEAVLIEENRNHPLLKPYFEGGERADNPYVNFYWDYFAQGKPAYVPIAYMSLSQGISLILDTGGIPVLAHPGQNIERNEKLLQEIIKEGIHGIEAYSSYHDQLTTDFYVKKAKEHQLIITGGSDFHGKNKPAISLGAPIPDGEDDKILESISTFFS